MLKYLLHEFLTRHVGTLATHATIMFDLGSLHGASERSVDTG
jgi:hypothetical protein